MPKPKVIKPTRRRTEETNPVPVKKRKLSETQLNVDVERATAELINRYCIKTGVSKKSLIELAILKFLNSSQARA